MSSILKTQFAVLSDNEALQLASALVSSVWRALAAEPQDHESAVLLLQKIQRLRTKLSWVTVILGDRGLVFDDGGALLSCKDRLIVVAREWEVDPVEFGETFTSLGVTDPWLFVRKASVIDAEFQEKKDRLKRVGIEFLKANPTCVESDLQAYLDNNFPPDEASLGKYLMLRYQKWSFNRGLIGADDFVSFRDFIVNTPVAVLESL